MMKMRKTGIRYFFLVMMIAGIIILSKDIFRLNQLIYSTAAYSLKSPIFNQSDYRDIFFIYDRNKWPQKKRLTFSESPANVVDWVLDRVDLNKPVNIIGQAAEIAPDYFNLEIARRKDVGKFKIINGYSSFFVTIEIMEGKYLDNYDFRRFNSYTLPYVRDVQKKRRVNFDRRQRI